MSETDGWRGWRRFLAYFMLKPFEPSEKSGGSEPACDVVLVASCCVDVLAIVEASACETPATMITQAHTN